MGTPDRVDLHRRRFLCSNAELLEELTRTAPVFILLEISVFSALKDSRTHRVIITLIVINPHEQTLSPILESVHFSHDLDGIFLLEESQNPVKMHFPVVDRGYRTIVD